MQISIVIKHLSAGICLSCLTSSLTFTASYVSLIPLKPLTGSITWCPVDSQSGTHC